MQRLAIQLSNGFLLVVILIGIPSITSARFGSLLLSSVPKAQKLTLWGLGLVAAFNSGTALWLAKDRKTRMCCAKWAFVFAALFAIEYSYFTGHLNFDWLKQTLEWVQQHL